MFGISFTELLLILAVALLVMGPEKIPEAARFVGKMMREVRKASNLLRDALALEDEPNKFQRSIPQVSPMAKSLTVRDPDPLLDVRSVTMRAVRNVRPKAVTLAAPKPHERPRETYLHVPYDETI